MLVVHDGRKPKSALTHAMPAPISWARGIIVERINTVLSRQYKKAEKSCFLFFSIAKLSFKGKQRNDPTEAERLGNVSTGTKVSTFSFRNWEGGLKSPVIGSSLLPANPDRKWVQ